MVAVTRAVKVTSCARIAIAVFGAVAEPDGLTTKNVKAFGTLCMDIAATQLDRDVKFKFKLGGCLNLKLKRCQVTTYMETATTELQRNNEVEFSDELRRSFVLEYRWIDQKAELMSLHVLFTSQYALNVFSMCSPCALHVLSSMFLRALSVVLSMCSPCALHVLSKCSPRPFHVLPMCCPCAVHVQTTRSPCSFHVLYITSLCFSCVLHVLFMCSPRL